ncbi:hypothetical protein LWI29_006503 [Acer saccharum]|uniref:Uncharacterized protein n=1 Tax=Acer saccharum TaxID=4024 RepID=A0AA39S2F3_ACESA|nr:hypothetical protein LWI29_006503 [Acer saccharum]
MDVAFLAYKSLSDISKIEPFNGSHFKRWQEKVTDTPDVLNFVDYLTQTKPEKNPEKPEENYAELLEAWNKRNKNLKSSERRTSESSSSSPLTNPKINPRIIITTTKEMTKKEKKSTAEGDDDDEDGDDDDEGRDGRRRRKG